MERHARNLSSRQANVKCEALPLDVLKVVVGEDQRPAGPRVKEEDEEDHERRPMKEEEDECDISREDAYVKVEDEGRRSRLCQEMAGAESSCHVTTRAEDGGAKTGPLLAPLPDGEPAKQEKEEGGGDWPPDTGNGDERFKCVECGKIFAKRKNLSTHMSLHSGEAHGCSFCGKAFKKRYNLLIHARVHTGEKPYACPLCGLKFSQKGSLARHAAIHTGQKTFTCSVCDVSLCQRSDLLVHSRIHTGEKPFDCALCGARFSQKGSLARHARTHTGEKPFSCSVCSAAYSRRPALLNHEKTHADGPAHGAERNKQ
ncbi:gastrula zinc finger protein XlCGF8.2DB-like [Hippocampus zosterae]|uniref:gastrula zinc finger protein XlCGF8.2DB-like n=1 Tax=Hippocampus zosterae TaxID=109293 RepID=UPI00223E734A|nr:gastrula zinc finger protein XlCGF8.2DB-like [Hippocampus zosterae]